MISTQLVVIGGGPGGYAAAFLRRRPRPAGHARRSRSESRRRLRLSRLHSVEGAAARRQRDRRVARTPTAWGVDFGEPKIDLDKLRDFKNSVVERADRRHRPARASCARCSTSRACATFVDAHTLDVTLDGRRRRDTLTFEHAIIATGSRPAMPPSLTLDDPRVMDSTGGARSARHPEVAARRRRRLHRPRARHRLRRARQRGHRRRDDAGAAARRRSRSRQRPRQAHRRRLMKRVLLNTQGDEMKAEAKAASASRSKAKAEHDSEQTFDRVLVVGRPPPELGRSRASTRRACKVDRARLHRGRRAAAHRTSRRSSPSATSPASRCSRTRRRTKGASRSK